MSEREPGLGSFVLGIAVGVTLGLMFAREGGEAFRGKIAARLRALRAMAADQAGDLGAMLLEADEAVSSAPDDDTPTSRHHSGRRRRRGGEEDVSSV
jgi:hypothetical protein